MAAMTRPPALSDLLWTAPTPVDCVNCAALFEPGTVTCYSCRARRYFAEKGERP